MDSFEKFSEDKLPDISKFYSFLKDERISKTDDCISKRKMDILVKKVIIYYCQGLE